MQEATLARNELPPYLGLGRLDPESIFTESGKTTARYLVDGEVIYEVSTSDQASEIQEFLDGKELGRSISPESLQKAFLNHMMSLTPYQNRRFERLYHEIVDNRNIFLKFPEQFPPPLVYFPAGYIFVLRQPIIGGYQRQWSALEERIQEQGEDGLVFSAAARTGVIFRLSKSDHVTAESVTVAECFALLLDLAAAARLLWESGVVPPEKEYQLMILDCSESMGVMRVRLGDPSRDCLTFSLYIPNDAETDMKKTARTFLESSKQLLARP